MQQFFIESFQQGLRIYWQVLKISFPILVVVKWLQDEFGFVSLFGTLLEPLMHSLNLPGEAGLVWATAIFLQLYAAILIAVSLWDVMELSVAQASVLGLLLLVAHNLLVEGRIVQRAGVRLIHGWLFRLGFGWLFAWLAAAIYAAGGWLQQPAVHLLGEVLVPSGWDEWFLYQLDIWLKIAGVIWVMVVVVNALKVSGIERHIIAILVPILKPFGIGKEAVTVTVVGALLGIAYGGGMLIEQAKQGHIPKKDLLCSLLLLCLLHAVIEDTILMFLIGADWTATLLMRVIFALVCMVLIAKYFSHYPQSVYRWVVAEKRSKSG